MTTIKARSDALLELGLSANATARDIREAWRNVAFHEHPDHAGGDYSEFSRAKAAYDFLREQGLTTASRPQTKKPRRPQLRKRVVELTAEEKETCDTLLRNERALSSDRLNSADNGICASCDHLPDAIGCHGRDLTYFVPTPVREGQNRVALPISVLSGARNADPQIVTFKAKSAGQGEIVVPDNIRERKFPGARSVRIRFNADEQMRDSFWLAS
ncbi:MULTISPECIES: J domain-containing protein [unclassified Ruegeria]|uniref:J domain-containing protein n=1 Tax=unclassified Ruegeria TaxID=2625375 RepID=UPI0020C3D45B|nr:MULTISPECIES: J domain-containing protein [unclassified Ruegeria]